MASKTPLPTWTTPDHECEYLHDRPARMEYCFAIELTPEEYEARMNAGWRKFGHLLFRPVCTGCSECRSIRIPVATFAPSRSQTRTLRRNADLKVVLGWPSVDAERLDLYHGYHAAQEGIRGWSASTKSEDDYAFSFVENPVPSAEIAVYDDDRLCAIVLTDITPNTVSGVYHFYDPAMRDRGIGVFSMLQTIEVARQMNKAYAYFGYYVADSASLAYKANFRPCELLGGDGQWYPFDH